LDALLFRNGDVGYGCNHRAVLVVALPLLTVEEADIS